MKPTPSKRAYSLLSLFVCLAACGEENAFVDDQAPLSVEQELELAGCSSAGEVVKVFDLCGFGAGSQWTPRCFGVGTYALDGAVDDDISSVQVLPGYEARLYDTSSSGAPLATLSTNTDLCGGSSNDKTSLLVVSQVATGSGGASSASGEPSEPADVGADPGVSTTVNGETVTIHPSDDPFVVRSGRFFKRGDKPFYVAGVGGPEGFAFESTSRKQQIIDELASRGARGIYFHLTRAYGGDGGAAEHLFKSNSDKTLDVQKLQALASFMDQLDQAGILMWVTLLDDHAKPWGCYSAQNQANYQRYAQQLTSAFKGYKHLIWVTKEEYDWGDCSHQSNVDLVKTLATTIHATDSTHAIATHHMNGERFAFSSDPNITVFGQQTGSNGEGDSVEHMHAPAGQEGWSSGAAYVMAEAHPYHKTLIRDGKSTEVRQSLWATAFAGGSVLLYDSYECHDPHNYSSGAWLCSGPNAGTNPAQPTSVMLDALRRVRRFMNSTRYEEMTPLFADALAARVLAGTRWILANDTKGLFLLFGSSSSSTLGLRNVASGSYLARWYDPSDGVPGELSGGTVVSHTGNALSLAKPSGIGAEAVLYLVRQGL